jgi:uncharacterized protein (TIGR02996 family)
MPRYDNPADDPAAEPFLRRLADSGGDPLHRQVFADWLDESGYANAAAGQRWAAKHGKAPGTTETVHDPATGNVVRAARGGWLMGGSENTHTGYAHVHGRSTLAEPNRRLPAAFFDTEGATGGEQRLYRSRLFRSGPDPFSHEHAFLDASHRLSYHPDTGEPLAPGTDEWSLPSMGTFEDPNA